MLRSLNIYILNSFRTCGSLPQQAMRLVQTSLSSRIRIRSVQLTLLPRDCKQNIPLVESLGGVKRRFRRSDLNIA